MSSATILRGRRKPTKEELYDQAIDRIKSYPTSPSTVGANLFFQSSHYKTNISTYAINRSKPKRPSQRELEREWKSLPKRVNQLRRHLESSAKSSMQSTNNESFESIRRAITAAVFTSASPGFLSSFQSLFAAILQQKSELHNNKSIDEDGSKEGDSDSEDENERESGLNFDQEEFYQSLRLLGWLPYKLNAPLCEALHEVILKHVYEEIEGEFEEDDLFETMMEWKNEVIVPWVKQVLNKDSEDFIEGNNHHQSNHLWKEGKWNTKLEYAVSECFCEVRIKEVFNIVAEYPDSLPAVHELKVALARTQMYPLLKQTLRSSLETRLIHPGANTSQIIDVYMNTIHVLRVIDPTDGLLEAVAPPVRSYLRSRSDTIRCIVTSLTDEEERGDLYQELRREDGTPLEHAHYDSDEEDDRPPEPNWTPALKQSNTKSRGGTGDILSMLVGIYGSKELFVNEYRILLADKLLQNLDYNTNREVHNLELLKLRFGEASMRQCEIMIKDMDDSKRIIANIHSTLKNKYLKKLKKDRPTADSVESIPNPIVDAAIVSHIFWPALQKDKLNHHPKMQNHLDHFALEYAKLKNPRRLEWFPHIGNVELELDLEEEVDGEIKLVKKEFACSPIQASIISHFEDKNSWSLKDLSEEMDMDESILKQKIMFWIHQKVIDSKILNDSLTFELVTLEKDSKEVEEEQSNSMLGIDMEEEPDDESDQNIAIENQEKEAMQVYESYIMGMLANLGKLPLDRIHNMLKMFVAGSDHKYNKTPHELSAFLQQMVKGGKLACGSDGLYALVKK